MIPCFNALDEPSERFITENHWDMGNTTCFILEAINDRVASSAERAQWVARGGSQTRPRAGTLQVNLGYRYSQSCPHGHVSAGPYRTEEMSWETMDSREPIRAGPCWIQPEAFRK